MTSTDATIVAAVIGAIASLITTLITVLSKGKNRGGHSQVAEGNSGPVNQKIINETKQVVIHHEARETGAPATAATAVAPSHGSSSDPWEPFIFAVIGAVLAMWALATWWDQIAIGLIGLVSVSLVLTASTWFTWRHLGASARWLSVLIVLVASAVVWSVFVLPTGFDAIPALDELAASAAAAGGGLAGFVEVLSLPIALAYVLRLLGLIVLLYLLAITTAEAWGMTLLSREALRDQPREGIVRFGTRFASLFKVNAGTLIWFTVMFGLAVAMIHPASLGWLLDVWPGLSAM